MNIMNQVGSNVVHICTKQNEKSASRSGYTKNYSQYTQQDRISFVTIRVKVTVESSTGPLAGSRAPTAPSERRVQKTLFKENFHNIA